MIKLTSLEKAFEDLFFLSGIGKDADDRCFAEIPKLTLFKEIA